MVLFQQPLLAGAHYRQNLPLDSMYQHLGDEQSVAKTHMVEWFSGGALNSQWTTTDLAGTNTFQMSDTVDGGFEIITDTNDNDRGQIEYNDIRHYNHLGSAFIAVSSSVSSTFANRDIGLIGTPNPDTPLHYYQASLDTDAGTVFRMISKDTSFSATVSDVTIDTNFHVFKGDTDGTTMNLFIDGLLKVTKTTNPPAAKMQPQMFCRTRSAAARTYRIRYFEAYNT